MGREIVHFEAPSPDIVDQEIRDFLKWLNSPAEIDTVLKAAIGHLWFVTIHPFDDGNGRIERAVADMLFQIRSKQAAILFDVCPNSKRKK